MQRDAFAVNCNDVKASARCGRKELQVICGKPAQARAFARMDAGDRASEGACRAQLNFDEHDLLAVLTDEVDLSSGKANVRCNN